MDPSYVFALAGVLVMIPALVILAVVTYKAVMANFELKRIVAKQDLTIESLTKDLNLCRVSAETRRTRLITAERKLQACKCYTSQP